MLQPERCAGFPGPGILPGNPERSGLVDDRLKELMQELRRSENFKEAPEDKSFFDRMREGFRS